MTTGTPDWSVPFTPKIKRLIDSDVTLAGGAATLGPFDVTGYTGILVEHLAITGEGSFGLLQFQFDDPQLSEFTPPTYVVNWKGDKAIKLNVPVMGPRVTLTYAGTFNGHQSHCTAVAHMGGGSASFGRNATVLAQLPGTAIAAGAQALIEATLIREGPAVLALGKAAQDFVGQVIATDHLGVATTIAEIDTIGRRNVSQALWIPPYSIAIAASNIGSAADAYNCSLTLGRA